MGSPSSGRTLEGAVAKRDLYSLETHSPVVFRALAPSPAQVEAKIGQMGEGGVGIVKPTQENILDSENPRE